MNDLETIKNRFPGISCAYRDAAGKVTTKCFGFADKEANVPVDENTAFPACSISKFITAICVIFRRFSGLQMHKSTCDLASRVQLYRKPRKKPPFRYTVELWCIENREEYPVFDTNSLFCIENLIKVPLVDTALKSVVSKTHINQAFSIQDHTLCI